MAEVKALLVNCRPQLVMMSAGMPKIADPLGHEGVGDSGRVDGGEQDGF